MPPPALRLLLGPVARRVLAGPLLAATLLVSSLLLVGSGCSALPRSTPGCQSLERLALVAQSVPSATFVPCVGPLPAGWSVASFSVERGRTDFSLRSDLSPGHPVRVRFTSSCDVGAAVPTTSRAPGIQTYIRVDSIDPRYSGALLDLFPGGCVTYQFSFERGAHIPLVQGFENSVELVSRHVLRLELHTKLGLELDQ